MGIMGIMGNYGTFELKVTNPQATGYDIRMITRTPEPEVMDDQAEAAAYAQADFSAVNEAFVQRLLELAGDCPTARAVDLGAGPADIPIRLAKYRPGWELTAVEASGAMLEIAACNLLAAGLWDRVALVEADAKDTGLDAGSYDVVFSNSILHHMSDPAELWAEIAQLAAPGALIFLRDLARPESAEQAAEIVRRCAGSESQLLQEEFNRSLLAAYTVDEVRAQLAQAHLSRLEVAMSSDRHLDVWGRAR